MNGQNNLWNRSIETKLFFPNLRGKIETDVVVIGGGFTGCSAALHIAEKGIKVCLLEARTIGAGGSGRSVGFVNSGLWASPDKIEKILGQKEGQRLNQALAKSPNLVFSLIEKFKIDCEFSPEGNLYCAHANSGWKILEDRYKQEQKRNVCVELVSSEGMKNRTGTSSFVGGLLYPDTGTINPFAYCQGLARAATVLGAEIYTDTPAVSIAFDGKNWQVETPKGHVEAKYLLLCTNAYHEEGGAVQKPQFRKLFWFQVATKPLPRKLQHSIIPGRHGCFDTDIIPTSMRVDKSGRFIIGSVGNIESFCGSVHKNWAKRKMVELFPSLETVEIECSWGGHFAMTNNNLPRIVRLGEKGISIYGYNGRGIGPGTFFGKCAAEYVLNGEEKNFPIQFVAKHTDPMKYVLKEYYEAGAVLWHSIKNRKFLGL